MIFFTSFKMKIYCDLLFEARELFDIKKEKKKTRTREIFAPANVAVKLFAENFNFSEYHQIVCMQKYILRWFKLSLVTLDII